ncbi:hypothetical protein SAMN02745134_00668 [Clostridium acidisoli DSM 12555]|uniref:Uncharacterized protein n=1 Tax=Clostridium acidisoli DSM 12555 TaxID=1121291 RepID=A0A1W1X4H9_9CLOT|nr:hypothetical protein [Clostridium acidisoli]SMC18806.1 hypothetical protein SAMN02745134_00668 [Clostridium acidisoli DSM 12555]
MNDNISNMPIGNLFSERQFLIVTKSNGANYYDKVLVPFAEYILNNEDTSDYKRVDSELTKKLCKYYKTKETLEESHKIFWKNASSIPRILPIIYFDKIDGREYIRITDIGKKHYCGEITCKEFLFLWILRFQGSEYSNKGVLSKSEKSIINACNYSPYRKLIENRIVKPGILALDVLKRVKEKGVHKITDKQFRHARKLSNQENENAVNEIVEIIIHSEANDTSQENQIFNVLEYLGLCRVTSYETNNYKYEITGLGEEVINKMKTLPFTYYHKHNTTIDFINYYGGLPNQFEEEIMEHYRMNGGNFDE